MNQEKYPRLAERLKEPVPKGRIEWAREFAMDVAVGFDEGAWGSKLYISGFKLVWHILPINDHNQYEILNAKWAEIDSSDWGNLVEQGFLRKTHNNYQLTSKSTNLALTPTISPTIFISYKHGPDATFALLVAKEVKERTNADPYHDESLQKQITRELEEAIERSVAVVCILGKDSLQRDSFVRVEIDLARKSEKQIEFFWLKGYQPGPIDDQPDDLKEWVDDQLAVRVLDESTKGNNVALGELIDRLYQSKYICMKL